MKKLSFLTLIMALYSVNSAHATLYVSGSIQITKACNANQESRHTELAYQLNDSHSDTSNRVQAHLKIPEFKLTLTPGCTNFENKTEPFVVDAENQVDLKIGTKNNDSIFGLKYSPTVIRMGLYPVIRSDDAHGTLAIDFDADRGRTFPFQVESSKGIRFEGYITVDALLLRK